jgi:hypothetical protein
MWLSVSARSLFWVCLDLEIGYYIGILEKMPKVMICDFDMYGVCVGKSLVNILFEVFLFIFWV